MYCIFLSPGGVKKIMRNFFRRAKRGVGRNFVSTFLVCVCNHFYRGRIPVLYKKAILGPAKTALTIFFKLCIPPFFGSEKFCFGVFKFLNRSIWPKIRPESLLAICHPPFCYFLLYFSYFPIAQKRL